MQNHYNLVYREEREMNLLCAVGNCAHAVVSLARGISAGAYQGFDGGAPIVRKDKIGLVPKVYHGEHVFQVAERVIEVASKYGKKPAR